MDEVDQPDLGDARAKDLLARWRFLPAINAALFRRDVDEALDSEL